MKRDDGLFFKEDNAETLPRYMLQLVDEFKNELDEFPSTSGEKAKWSVKLNGRGTTK